MFATLGLKKTQQQKVLEYLKLHGEATIRRLITELWINNPQKAVEMLRHKGHKINTVPVEGQRYDKYIYISEKQLEIF